MSTIVTGLGSDPLYPDGDAAQFEMHLATEIVGEKFVGTTSQRDEGFDATIAATILDQTYDEYFKAHSEAFENATPSLLSQLALEKLNEQDPDIGLDNPTSVGIANNGVAKSSDNSIA